MRTHEIKTHDSVWADLLHNFKTAEFRINDRDYKYGDRLIMKRTDENGTLLENFPNTMVFVVRHIVYGPEFGIPEGFCMMSISKTT